MASTAGPTVFFGSSCPKDAAIGFIHGTAPAAARVTLLGSRFLPQWGSLQTIQIGPSRFTGYVVGREYSPINDETVIHLVDWRDKLHDFHLVCAFNCEEDDGRFYHILPGSNWQEQRKTYVTREVGQLDFNAVQRLPAQHSFNVQIARNILYSALTIADWIGFYSGFYVRGDLLALYKMSVTYPLNLDWNNGSTKVIDGLQQIMNKCGLQMTFTGSNTLYVTVRGFTENIVSGSLPYIGDITTFCLLGISSGKIGEELNEQGRKVVILGDRNKHELVFPCRANWNPAWTIDMALGAIKLTGLLTANGLTVLDKVGDLPEEYHDNETWNDGDNAGEGAVAARKTRNQMTIRDYLDKIVGKAYVVDSGYYMKEFNTVTNSMQGTAGFLDPYTLERSTVPAFANLELDIQNFARTMYFDAATANFKFPIARTLVTDSNLQWIVYCTSDQIEKSEKDPFAGLGFQKFFVPRSRGCNVEVEDVVNPLNGEAEYRVRVFFDNVQVFHKSQGQIVNPQLQPDRFYPDQVLVRLALERDIYTYAAGDRGGTRTREQVINIRNLYRAFVNFEEVSILKENTKDYWDKTVGAQPLSYRIVRADDIASSIAFQALAHYSITLSGSVHYDDICGSLPDGLIESVQVNWSGLEGDGITEDVNFTDGFAEDREFRHPFPLKVSRRYRDEDELILDRLQESNRRRMQEQQQAGKIMQSGLQNLKNLGQMAVGLAKDGLAEVKFTLNWLLTNAVETGELIGLRDTDGDETAPTPPPEDDSSSEEESV